MMPRSRAAGALLAALAAAAPARAAAQQDEAWVLPRGLLELGATGAYTRWDARLGGAVAGAELLPAYRSATERLLGTRPATLRTGLAALFAGTPDPEPGTPGDSATAGTAAFRLAADVRQVPFTLRYGLTDRLTVFATVPLERSGTVVFGPHLAGANLGLNPNAAANRAALARLDSAYADLGGGLLLPTRDSPLGRELQSRLPRTDTLLLPARPVTYAELLAQAELRSLLTAEEAAALGLRSMRRPYHLGDVQVGARFLLVPGPAGWPFPDSVVRRSFRTALGVRARLPTGAAHTRFFTEVAPGGGHFGVGVDALTDVFFSRRWSVNVAAAGDWLMPRDVQRQAFGPARPFPGDSALASVRLSPGARLALSVTPRWRLTDEISFQGEYAVLAQAATEYAAPDSVSPLPLEWTEGGMVHGVGIGMRYSSLQAFARGRARVPFEVTVGLTHAVLGSDDAPDYGTVRITGRIFADPRRLAAVLRRAAADTAVAQPPAGPTDTTPSQPRPRPPADTTAPPPPPPRRP